MAPPETLLLIAATFLIAGFVKGLVGFGLPTIALALLTATIGFREAVALMLLPSVVTNFWQAVAGGALRAILGRLWPLLAVACLGIWIGAGLSAETDTAVLTVLLGTVLCLYASLSLATPQVPPPGDKERWLSPSVGAVGGMVTGLTGTFVVPGVLYMQALGLSRDVLVQAMGVLFLTSTVALGLSLADHGLLSVELGLMSFLAILPTVGGMWLGQRGRSRLPEAWFRPLFFTALLVLGLYILARQLLPPL